jgi:hypothetical protein
MDEDKLEEAMAETVEQSFNDSELEDIMNEIESLEKEFVDDGEKSPEELALKEAPTSSLQSEIDKEVESISEEMAPVAETTEAPVAETTVEAVTEEVVEEITEVKAEEMAEEVVAEIEAEIESTPVIEEPAAVDNVVSLPVSQSSESTSGASMDFSASGSMDLNLNFKIGNETATLKVDGEAGLIVEMGGVEIKITETEGCSVTMEGGVNFNIPLTTSATDAKKKSA